MNGRRGVGQKFCESHTHGVGTVGMGVFFVGYSSLLRVVT